jgi:hypothetical protein
MGFLGCVIVSCETPLLLTLWVFIVSLCTEHYICVFSEFKKNYGVEVLVP